MSGVLLGAFGAVFCGAEVLAGFAEAEVVLGAALAGLLAALGDGEVVGGLAAAGAAAGLLAGTAGLFSVDGFTFAGKAGLSDFLSAGRSDGPSLKSNSSVFLSVFLVGGTVG